MNSVGNMTTCRIIVLSLLLIVSLIVTHFGFSTHATAGVFSDGFENGDLSAWWTHGTRGNDSKLYVQNVVAYNGSYALAAVAGSNRYDQGMVMEPIEFQLIAIYARGYFYLSSLPTYEKGTSLLMFWDKASLSTTHALEIACLHIYYGTALGVRFQLAYVTKGLVEHFVADTTITPHDNTWYYLELAGRTGEGDGWLKGWIAEAGDQIDQDSPTFAISNLETGDYSYDAVGCGSWSSTGGYTTTVYVDDVKIGAYYGPDPSNRIHEFPYVQIGAVLIILILVLVLVYGRKKATLLARARSKKNNSAQL
jgi:hypothetical protein